MASPARPRAGLLAAAAVSAATLAACQQDPDCLPGTDGCSCLPENRCVHGLWCSLGECAPEGMPATSSSASGAPGSSSETGGGDTTGATDGTGDEAGTTGETSADR